MHRSISHPEYRHRGESPGFTLVELLVVIAIIGLLAALASPALLKSIESGRALYCLNNMRQIGTAIMLYADDHDDCYPRSQHSAFAHGELVWARAVTPYLGSSSSTWKELLETVYHCPSDPRNGVISYGLNVYYELGPEDDYPGYPATWRRRSDVKNPSATILLAENESEADHIMPNFWSSAGDAVDVAFSRHSGKANYVFADGHVESREFNTVYDPARQIDQWNPGP